MLVGELLADPKGTRHEPPAIRGRREIRGDVAEQAEAVGLAAPVAHVLVEASGRLGLAARVLEAARVSERLGPPAEVVGLERARELAVEEREIAQRGRDVPRLAPEQRGAL